MIGFLALILALTAAIAAVETIRRVSYYQDAFTDLKKQIVALGGQFARRKAKIGAASMGPALPRAPHAPLPPAAA